MKVIAHIETDFNSKFGVPRQSGVIQVLEARIVFEPAYRNPEAFRGLEGFSHIWLIWHFSEAERQDWSPTVRPPRLGGNTRMGVFATRSPFRPNAIGLSSVRLTKIELDTPVGPVLHVAGADLMNGTPIYDIKPYLAYTDAHPEATGGFTDVLEKEIQPLKVQVDEEMLKELPADKREALLQVLAADPRPHYQKDPERVYGFTFANKEVKFQVKDGVILVVGVSLPLSS